MYVDKIYETNPQNPELTMSMNPWTDRILLSLEKPYTIANNLDQISGISPVSTSEFQRTNHVF